MFKSPGIPELDFVELWLGLILHHTSIILEITKRKSDKQKKNLGKKGEKDLFKNKQGNRNTHVDTTC